eukprot:TRINITY_DN1330_c1_g1_i2.p1 TRINITY_DN1330_c1_g1~~TRINITY_DN1330_c1_g1_i2.p1  ORF type:complete len:380 (-),score=33.30 TRINITY_DN1330_c1_g1_i2:1662-2801(-)
MSKLLMCFFLIVVVVGQDFQLGRATFYGNEPWLWSIHWGSCGYGYLCPEEGTGWDVAALADFHPEYLGSCGRCYEVQCHPTYFTDGYGETLDRVNVCRDPSASVVVTITDTCPCVYATNAYSNKRWCCGDMHHFDLSVWAFEKLAEHRWGVVGLRYRQVPCDYVPYKPAPPPPQGPYWGEGPEYYMESCPKFAFPYRGGMIDEMVSVGAVQLAAQNKQKQFLVLQGENGVGNFELSYWNTEIYETSENGRTAICGKVNPGGSISISGNPGSFSGHMAVQFWNKASRELPNAALNIQGQNNGCNPLMFNQLDPIEQDSDGYFKYKVELKKFAGDHSVDFSTSTMFQACNGMPIEEFRKVTFTNYQRDVERFCIDQVALTD